MRKLCFCFLVLLMGACSLMPVNVIGDIPQEVRISAIKIGKHNREDVQRLLGSPMHATLFEEESWIWVESQEQMRAFLPPKEIERKVVIVTFDENGVAKRVARLDITDSIKVAYDSEETPSHGKDLNVFEELMGNFGRFSATKETRN